MTDSHEIDVNRAALDLLDDVLKETKRSRLLKKIPEKHRPVLEQLQDMNASGDLPSGKYPRTAMARCLTKLTGVKVTHQSLSRFLGDETAS